MTHPCTPAPRSESHQAAHSEADAFGVELALKSVPVGGQPHSSIGREGGGGEGGGGDGGGGEGGGGEGGGGDGGGGVGGGASIPPPDDAQRSTKAFGQFMPSFWLVGSLFATH